MSCGVMDKCKMYYVSNFINHSEIHCVDLNDIPFEEACICKLENNLPFQKDEAISQETSFFTESFTGNLDDINFQLSDYSPWKYMKKGSFKFFFPVRDINLEKGVIKEPGLGFTFETQADPFSNNELLLSVANGFIPLDFTKLFNASKKTNQTVKAEKTEKKLALGQNVPMELLSVRSRGKTVQNRLAKGFVVHNIHLNHLLSIWSRSLKLPLWLQ